MRYLAQNWNGCHWVTMAQFAELLHADLFIQAIGDTLDYWRIYDSHV